MPARSNPGRRGMIMTIARAKAAIVVLMVLFSLQYTGTRARSDSKPQLKSDANIFDCKACHGGNAVLPDKHPDVKEEPDCAACHKIGTEYKPVKQTSLRGRLSLMHLHGLNEVGCGDCHEDLTQPEPLESADCLQCHDSYEFVVEKTVFLEPFNPHASTHYGKKQACDICHFIHEKSEYLCADCHDVYRPIP
jgi:hypothetical protein